MPSPATNVGPILTTSTGKRPRVGQGAVAGADDERANRTPRALSISRSARNDRLAWVKTVSVSSRVSRAGSMAALSTVADTCSHRSACRSWRPRRFTAICRGRSRLACQAACWWQASAMTQPPMGMISPELSATSRKSGWTQQPAAGVIEAQQGFDACHLSVGEVDDRLVVQAEPAGVEGVVQVVFDVEALDGLRAQSLVEDTSCRPRPFASPGSAWPYRRLGAVRTGRRRRRGSRRRRCWRRRRTCPRRARWVVQGGLDPVDDAGDVVVGDELGGDDDELVAADACGGVVARTTLASRRPTSAGSGPRAVAHAVVDGLKIVEVEVEHGDRRVRSGRVRQGSAGSRATSRCRFASPVSGSCMAWWASRSWACIGLGDVLDIGGDRVGSAVRRVPDRGGGAAGPRSDGRRRARSACPCLYPSIVVSASCASSVALWAASSGWVTSSTLRPTRSSAA